MLSNLLSNRIFRIRKRLEWSLRARLLAVQGMLLAIVCVCVGAGTLLAMNHYLTQTLDEQVSDAVVRSRVIFQLGLPPPPLRQHSRGPGPQFLDAPGQSIGMVGAVLSGDNVTEAAVITANGDRLPLTRYAYRQLASVPEDQIVTIDLDGLGEYRLIKTPVLNAYVITGLPRSGVDRTLLSAAAIFSAASAVALSFAVIIGAVIIRRQLAPLSQVATAAQEVADLELGRGEINLPALIADIEPEQAHTEVGTLGLALNRMLDRVADALSVRQASETRVRQFVADASHELRTPLAAIRGYAELAQRHRHEVPAQVGHAMGRVESEAARMTELVADLLLLARLDSGRPLAHEPVDLSRLTVDAVSDAHIAAPSHLWSLDLPDEPMAVLGDSDRLHQVIANLLANCRTHTPPGTRVTVLLARNGDDAVVLTVEDDGPGIPTSLQPEIFERFARGDASRSRRDGGTGLGLAIALAVAKAHQGAIDVRSHPGHTAFTVTLPTKNGWPGSADSGAFERLCLWD